MNKGEREDIHSDTIPKIYTNKWIQAMQGVGGGGVCDAPPFRHKGLSTLAAMNLAGGEPLHLQNSPQVQFH